MKKITALTLIAFCSLPALAQGQGGFSNPVQASAGGFSGPSVTATTIEQAKSLRDDAKVTLRGYIEKSLGGDNYLFKDETGTITVDIDSHRWNGQNVTPKDKVELQGEVDKDWNSVEIDVDRIIKL